MTFENIHQVEVQSYEENELLLRKAEENSCELGLFEKDFLTKLNYCFIGDARYSEGKIVPFKLEKNNYLSEESIEKNDATRDVVLLSKDFLEKKFNKFLFDIDDVHDSIRVLLNGVHMDKIFSFDASAIHEIAHAKSYEEILPNSESFNKGSFSAVMKNIAGEDLYTKNLPIDFEKFNFSQKEWSEIYAMLYQREFIRRKEKNNTEINYMDSAIYAAARDKEEIGKLLSLDSELIYKENHSLSLLLSGAIERAYKNFDERIGLLKSFKTPA